MDELVYGEISIMPKKSTGKVQAAILLEDEKYNPPKFLYRDELGNFKPYPLPDGSNIQQRSQVYTIVQNSEVILRNQYRFFQEKDESVVTSKMDFINRFYSLVNEIVKVTQFKTHLTSDNFLDGINVEFLISREELSTDSHMEKLFGKIVYLLSD